MEISMNPFIVSPSRVFQSIVNPWLNVLLRIVFGDFHVLTRFNKTHDPEPSSEMCCVILLTTVGPLAPLRSDDSVVFDNPTTKFIPFIPIKLRIWLVIVVPCKACRAILFGFTFAFVVWIYRTHRAKDVLACSLHDDLGLFAIHRWDFDYEQSKVIDDRECHLYKSMRPWGS